MAARPGTPAVGADEPEAREAPSPVAPQVPAEVAPQARRPSWRVRTALVGALVIAGTAVAAVLLSPAPLPDTVPPPALRGQLLLGYSRASNPQSAPHAITFEPTYYTAYQPRGRRVRVALRCIGNGSVRISAGPRFTFRCTEQERVLVRTSGPVASPFLILGRTTGNVVWGVSIVLLPPARSARP